MTIPGGKPIVVYAGAVAPENAAIDLVPGKSGLDLSTVTAASFKVRHADGTVATWACVLSHQTSTTLRISHVFAAGDVPVVERCVGVAYLTVSGGTVRSAPFAIEVRDALALPC